MQLRSALVAAVLAAATHGSAGAKFMTSAKSFAMSWLDAHSNAPQSDELAELKTVNPDAYAIVKALLTKRSLGLLDPRHPSASFAGGAPPSSDVPQGPEAFAKIAAESGEKPKAALAYPDAPVSPVHHDWLNWKPQQSALDDESMVNNVLGAVASLKGGGGSARSTSSSDAGETSSLTWTSPAADAPVTSKPEAVAVPVASAFAAPVEKPVAAPSQENSYLKGIDLDGSAAETSAPRKAHSSSLASEDSKSALSSFSWGDDASSAQPEPAAAPAAVPTSQGHPKNALLDWLRPKAAQRKAPPTTAPAQNPYLSVLSN